MRTIGKQWLFAAVAAVLLTGVSAPREAEAVSLNLINTWRMGDMASWGNSFNGYVSNGPAWERGAVPKSGINIHFGLGVGKGDQAVPYIGLALVRSSYQNSYLIDDDADGDRDDEYFYEGSAVQFGIDIGAKFFIIERAKGKAPPFVQLAFYKYVGSVVENSRSDEAAAHGIAADYESLCGEDDWGDCQLFDQDILSPTGFRIAFGAEYYFNDNFALGGEFFGIDFSWSQGVANVEFDRQAVFTNLNLYTSLHLTYRFSFTVRASVQFESDYDYED